MTILAMVATVIASQAVISGAYSVARQAMRLGYLPNLAVRHTSSSPSGQVYLPLINTILLVAVVTVVVTFQSSTGLASAYGLAVTTTLLLDTVLFGVYARFVRRWDWWRVLLLCIPLLIVETAFFAANSAKILTGGWLPLMIGLVLIAVMTTWQRGRESITARRRALEGSLADLLASIAADPPARVPGTAVRPRREDLDVEDAVYFLSRISLERTQAPGLVEWRKWLFLLLARMSSSPARSFKLPPERTIELSTHLTV